MKRLMLNALWDFTKNVLIAVPTFLIFVGVVWLLNVFEWWAYVPFVLVTMYFIGRATTWIWQTRRIG